ncbi:MAG: hypothetical protein AAF998_18045 [Bacteroidota bacterium]
MRQLLAGWLFLLLAGTISGQNSYAIILADDQGDIRATVYDKAYFGYLTLQNRSDSALAIRELELSPFINVRTGEKQPGILQLDGTPAPPTATLSPGKALRVEFRSELPDTGTYQALLGMAVYGKADTSRISRKIRVQRTKKVRKKVKNGGKKPFFRIAQLYNVSGIRGELVAKMVVEDTAGRGGTIAQISPVVWRKKADNSRESLDFGAIQLRNEAGDTIEKITFAPESRRSTVLIDLTNLDLPGSFQGEIYLAADGYQAVSGDFNINSKSSWWVAIALIALGLTVAAGLRYLLTVAQPRLNERQQVSQLAVEISGLLPEEQELRGVEREVLAQLNTQVATLDRQLAYGTVSDLAVRIQVIREKEKVFLAWLGARRPFINLTSEQQKPEWGIELDAAQRYLDVPGGELKTGKELQAKLQTVREKALTAELRHLGQTLVAAIKKDADTGSKLSAEIKTWAALTAQDPPSRDRLQTAYDALIEGYERQLLQKLERLKRKPLQEVPPDDWTRYSAKIDAASAQVEQSEGIAARVSALLHAYRVYLRASLDWTRSQSQGYPAQSPRTAAIVGLQELDEEWPRLSPSQCLNKFSDCLTRLQVAWDLPRHRGADDESSAQDAIRRLKNTASLTYRATTPRAGETAELFLPPPQSRVPKHADLEETKRRAQDENRSVTQQKLIAELVSTAVVLVISTLLGVLILWIPNATWGNASDIIYALLWGFGLHTVSKSTDITGTVGQFVRGKVSG